MAEIDDHTALIKQAVDELGVDKPIMSYRVVGNRVELYLLGGDVAVWPGRSGRIYDFEQLSLKELRRTARMYNIRGRSKMSRAQLIEALEALSTDP
jgi:hypothetical protein